MILLVEDDPVCRTIFAEILRGYGYEVLEARDGVQALVQVIKHRDIIRLVITDIILPNINGFALIENVRTLLPRVPLIAVSSYISQASGEKILGGDVDFLQKPVRPSALMAHVQRILPLPNDA